MRHLRRLLVALLTFLVSVAITPIHFELEGMGVGRVTDGGGGFSTNSYTSSSSARLVFSHLRYASNEKANEVFNDEVRKAIRVVEITPKHNAKGELVGQRVVATFLDRETKQSYSSISWTDGRFIHAIESTSLLHVIEFEKQNLGTWGPSISRIRYLLAPDAR